MLKPDQIRNKGTPGRVYCRCPKCGRPDCKFDERVLFREDRTAFDCHTCGFLKQGSSDPEPLTWIPSS